MVQRLGTCQVLSLIISDSLQKLLVHVLKDACVQLPEERHEIFDFT